VTEVLEHFDDGRMNIVVTGEQPFRVLERFEGVDYPEGEIEPITPEDESDEEDPEAADMARQAFVELVKRVAGDEPEELDIEAEDSYGIASRVELPVETKQALLEQRSEPERMRMLGNALRALVAAVNRSSEIAERAKMNGKVIVG
jgi:ATP-dependent Lon protease